MKQVYLIPFSMALIMALNGCGPKAADFYTKGTDEMSSYDCASVQSFKTASDMEIENQGKWYPIYMLSLGLSRYYCNDYPGALKAFQTIDQFVVLRSERATATKAVEFVKSKEKREYELTEREETLYHFYMGMSLYKMGNYSDALIEFKKVDYIAEGTYSKLPLIALMRGLTYAKLGQIDNALVGFRKIIEQNPNSPVGYELAILSETNESNLSYFSRLLQDSCGVKFEKPKSGEQAIVTVLECKGELKKENSSFEIQYDDQLYHADLFDVARPDFSFGKFAAGLGTEVASMVARDAAKNAASNLVPGGGLLAGLFLGGDGGDNRSWATVPDFYVVNIAIIPQHKNPTLTMWLRGKEEKRSTAVDISACDVVTLSYHI